MNVLVVNAGSTSLKLHLVRGDAAEQVDEILPADAVGHRVVHGGRFDTSCVIDEEVEREIERLTVLAPLQNRRTRGTADRTRSPRPG